jgi:hypothetical protein
VTAPDPAALAVADLPLEEKIRLLEDLHRPSAPLGADARRAHAALVTCLPLDPAYLAEEDRRRALWREAIRNDAECQAGLRAWVAGTDGEDSAATCLQRLAALHAGAFSVEPPLLHWRSENSERLAAYDPESGHLRLNRNLARDRGLFLPAFLQVLHYRTQDEWVGQWRSGRWPRDDARAAQVRILALLAHRDAWISPEEDFIAFTRQPSEALSARFARLAERELRLPRTG